ncbi:hypothetical protein ACFE04_005259 [Oxalis oulophora]
MAIAGLHNVSVLESPFLRDSQSQTSRREGVDGTREGTRASSLLQMWRELEDEHVVGNTQERVTERLHQQQTDMVAESQGSENCGASEDASIGENDSELWSPSQNGSQNGHEDPNSLNRESSANLGAVERGRVRKIFREWMNTGTRECSSQFSRMNSSSSAEWLGENEQERVRIIREWVQMNSQQRESCGESREDQGVEIGGQIERALDGLVVNQNRRGIRKLCGRQALLDMVKKAERERQRELQVLSEHRAVSQFAHRNRIQSLLKGRFLRNVGVKEVDRPPSLAASELGLLRQRHTVSGLRDGFFSRKDQTICGQSSSNQTENTSSSCGINYNKNEQNEISRSHEVINEFSKHPDANHMQCHSPSFSDTEVCLQEPVSQQEVVVHTQEWQEQVSDNEDRDLQQFSDNELSERIAVEPPCDNLQNADVQHAHLRESSLTNDSISEEHSTPVDQWQEELYSQVEEREWQQGDIRFDDFRHSVLEDLEVYNEDNNSHRSSEELLGDDIAHNSHLGLLSHEDGSFEEEAHNWTEQPSDQEDFPVQRADTYYFPDDDHVHGTEIRELLSRRSVSTLLSSGFRESLDHLIQSYVERQNHAVIDWELQEGSPSQVTDQDIDQQSRDHTETQLEAADNPLLAIPPPPPPPPPPMPPMPPMQSLWDDESHHDNWSTVAHNMHHRFGIEWDIINDMRVDMARLQQRMNNMQRMLETCMDMQLELQRSIRQEVSAALNRSAGTPGGCDNILPVDESKWDCVRKGLCCICQNSNIDSLLYRCGHMCTCSKCANELVQTGEKCPMCRAPVVEVVRAYSIQ